jgi:hypothetical protein
VDKKILEFEGYHTCRGTIFGSAIPTTNLALKVSYLKELISLI